MAEREHPDKFAAALTGVYATDPNYGANLISLMRRYDLYHYSNSVPAVRPHHGPAVAVPGSAAIPGVPGVPPRHRPSRARPRVRPPRLRSRPARRVRVRPAQPGPQPTRTASPQPTRTSTPEPTRTASPGPTGTASPQPTATASPQPTRTASPQPTPTAAAQPSATGQPNGRICASPAGGQATSGGHELHLGAESPHRPRGQAVAAGFATLGHAVSSTLPSGHSRRDHAVRSRPPADIRGQLRPGARFVPVTRSASARSASAGSAQAPARSAQAPARSAPAERRAAKGRSSAAPVRATLVSRRRYQQHMPRSVLNSFVQTAKGPLLSEETLYRDVASFRGIDWRLLAACDWMQCDARPRRSPVYGERLGSLNSDGTMYTSRSAALARCADDLIRLARTVYGIDLTGRRDLSVRDLANAFAAFRWGGLLKTNDCSAMEFPYSVAGLTEHHLGMRWPRINEAPPSPLSSRA